MKLKTKRQLEKENATLKTFNRLLGNKEIMVQASIAHIEALTSERQQMKKEIAELRIEVIKQRQAKEVAEMRLNNIRRENMKNEIN